MQTQTVGPQAQSPVPPPGFPDCGRGRTRLARASREQAKLAAKATPAPQIVQPHVAVKRGKLNDPSMLRKAADPTTLLAMAAILVIQQARRKHRAELQVFLTDLLEEDLSDETVLRYVIQMPFGRKVDAGGVLAAAAQLCREHCPNRVYWQEKAADLTELSRNGTLDLDRALWELSGSDDAACGIINK